jgi:hypothetical protein
MIASFGISKKKRKKKRERTGGYPLSLKESKLYEALASFAAAAFALLTE